MQIIEMPDLDPAYRLYQTESGRYIRIKVELLPQQLPDSRFYKMTAEDSNENGEATGLISDVQMITQKLGDVPLCCLDMVEALPLDAGVGDMVVFQGQLYRFDGENWQDHGLAPAALTPAMAEALVMLDDTARRLVQDTERLFIRRDSDAMLENHLGFYFDPEET